MKLRNNTEKIDLHIHTQISDGTDSPSEIISVVRGAGIGLFSVTDHDAAAACLTIRELLTDDDPLFISGVEFSCRDILGKYHILAYGYDPQSPSICTLIKKHHEARIEEVGLRLDALKKQFDIIFTPEDIQKLYACKNPGKPHIANLLVKTGHAESRKKAFENILNKLTVRTVWFHPEETIAGILAAGGIPVLAHPSFGSGEQLITGKALEERIDRLTGFGLKGIEAYYSGFTEELLSENLALAEKKNLYVTAGSDYHGKNKKVIIGDTHLSDIKNAPAGLHAFLEAVPVL